MRTVSVPDCTNLTSVVFVRNANVVDHTAVVHIRVISVGLAVAVEILADVTLQKTGVQILFSLPL